MLSKLRRGDGERNEWRGRYAIQYQIDSVLPRNELEIAWLHEEPDTGAFNIEIRLKGIHRAHRVAATEPARLNHTARRDVDRLGHHINLAGAGTEYTGNRGRAVIGTYACCRHRIFQM